jgi:hypothetical protein
MTAPLLLILAADSVVAMLITRNCLELALAAPAEPDGND